MDEALTNCYDDYVNGKDVYYHILELLNNMVNDGKYKPSDLMTAFANRIMEKSSQRNDAETFKMVLDVVHEKIFGSYVWNSKHAEMHNHIKNFVWHHNVGMIDFIYGIYEINHHDTADGSRPDVDTNKGWLRITQIFIHHDHIVAFANYDSVTCEYILNKMPPYSRNILLSRITNKHELSASLITPQIALLLCV